MSNERIKAEMMFAGVSVKDLAKYLGKTEQETFDLLNTELGIMQNYMIMLAVTEIARRRKKA